MSPEVKENVPENWLDTFPVPTDHGHKYHRGHALIIAAPQLTGATRLAASACSRMGAGLVTVLAPEKSDVYRSTLPPDIMVRETWPDKVSVCLCGPGGSPPEQHDKALSSTGLVARVFDAGGLPDEAAFNKLDANCVLTPHTGEFSRLYGPVGSDDGMAALALARNSGATVVLKSSRTVIASPDGRLIRNENTSPYLAKAGTGDVLAGMITGLVSQQMPAFDAACAAVWIHGQAGREIGPGLVAGDLIDQIPSVLNDIF